MKGKKFLLLLGIVCLALMTVIPSAVACTPSTPTTQTFNLGVLEGLSGQFSENTVIQVEGIQIAVDMWNEKGGLNVNGEKYLINQIIEDSKNTPEGVSAGATRLVYDHNLKFIAGCGMAATCHAEVTVTNPAGVVASQDWNNGTSQELNADAPYVLKGVGGTVEVAACTIDYLVRNYPEVKTLLNIMPDDGAIADVSPHVEKFAAAKGLTMAGPTFGWPLDTVDFYPLATKCLSYNADAWLVNPGWESHVAFFLKAGREQGFDGVVMGSRGAFFNMLATSGGDPNVVTRLIMPGFSTETVEEMRALPDDMFTPLFKDVGERSFAAYGHFVPDTFKGFDCAWVLFQAIEAAQSFDPDVVAATWKTMDTMETGWGVGPVCGKETFGVNSVVAPKVPMQVADNGVMRYAGMGDQYLP